MKTKFFILAWLLILFSACQSETDEWSKYDASTDTFLLVDYYEGVYKFVQINNLYTIGVEEGLLDVPEDFVSFEDEKLHSYYQVQLKLTGMNNDSYSVKYQRFNNESSYYHVKQAGQYTKVTCSVTRVAFFNDYLYTILN